MYKTLTSNSPNNIAQTNVKLANINKLPPNAPKLNGVILCTLPACKKEKQMSVQVYVKSLDEQKQIHNKKKKSLLPILTYTTCIIFTRNWHPNPQNDRAVNDQYSTQNGRPYRSEYHGTGRNAYRTPLSLLLLSLIVTTTPTTPIIVVIFIFIIVNVLFISVCEYYCYYEGC